VYKVKHAEYINIEGGMDERDREGCLIYCLT